jgi:hypothetical protein
MVDWCYIFSILSLGAYPLPKTIYNGSNFGPFDLLSPFHPHCPFFHNKV